MGMKGSPERIKIVKDALDRFPTMPSKTMARYLLKNYGLMWDNNLETIRKNIGYYRGQLGRANLAKLQDEKYITNEKRVMPKTWRHIRTPYKLNPGLWLVAACAHVPFHEPKPIESMIKYAQEQGCNGILFNGDLQDCQAVTQWPTAHREIDAEIEAMCDFLAFIKYEMPDCEMVWKPGNHEYRLPRYYISKAPELAGSLIGSIAMELILDLENRGIEFLDYYQIVMAGKLPILHGHEFKINRAVNPARGLFLKAKTWALCSHHHSSSQHTERNLMGDVLTTWSTGCLCDLSPDYQPYSANWNWGFAIVNVEPNGDFEVRNYRVLSSGKVV